MAEPYTIRIFVPTGDPEGVKIVDLLNWTGVGVAFPRLVWPELATRPEFRRSGVYILTGPTEGTDDDLPTVYVGQGDEVGARIESHTGSKPFWDWGYVFVSSNGLNRAHITWLEYRLIDIARTADRCHLDNSNYPREPKLSEADRADTQGFLREMLRILPLLGVRVFEKPAAVARPGSQPLPAPNGIRPDGPDTVVVPAQEDGFTKCFLGQHCWHAVRIGGGMLPRIKYVAAYQTAPVKAITHYAPVERIETYGDEGKYRLVFTEPAKPLPHPVPLGDSPPMAMRGPRYTNLAALLTAKRVSDVFATTDVQSANGPA